MEIPLSNKHLVALLDDTVIISGLTPQRLSFAEALNLAAWLIAMADDPTDNASRLPIHLQSGDVVDVELSESFLVALAEVQES